MAATHAVVARVLLRAKSRRPTKMRRHANGAGGIAANPRGERSAQQGQPQYRCWSRPGQVALAVGAAVDPAIAPVLSLPREEIDLYIAARNGHVLAFDNVSVLKDWQSDALCRISSGASYARRRLYTDQDEALITAQNPVILNGIEEVVVRQDLADRTLHQTLESIPEDSRLPEDELWARFHEEHPVILGGLLDAMVHGLKNYPKIAPKWLPKMAD